MPERQRYLRTFDAVVHELGGPGEVGRLTKQNSAAVCNWKRRRRKFPTKYYFLMHERLEAQGAKAPRYLWGFVRSERR